MERRKLVYNAIQDLWKISAQGFANKSIVDMEDNDWTELINAIDASAKKIPEASPRGIRILCTNMQCLHGSY